MPLEVRGTPDSEQVLFEDLKAGQRYSSGPRAVEAVGVDTALVLLTEHRFVQPQHIVDLEWRSRASIEIGDEVSCSLTVTRCRRSPDRATGLVRCYIDVRDQTDSVVQEGTSGILVPARQPDAGAGSDSCIFTDFCSPGWADALRPLLAEHPAFLEATQAYDGSIGLQCGADVVQLRIYKGAIIDVAQSTPAGPSFILAGTEIAWLRLALADRNDFIARVSKGHFSMSGSAYDYLRFTKAIVAIWDAVRDLAAQDARQ